MVALRITIESIKALDYCSQSTRSRERVGEPLLLLSTTTEAQHQVESGLLLDVIVRQRAAVLQLLAREDQALLVRRDALLVLDLLLHVLDRVGRLHVERDGLARQRLYEDLHGVLSFASVMVLLRVSCVDSFLYLHDTQF